MQELVIYYAYKGVLGSSVGPAPRYSLL